MQPIFARGHSPACLPRRPAGLLAAILAGPHLAAAELAGLSLAEAIEHLERQGLSVFYSSALVKPDMRVETEPADGDLHQRLESILAPFGLTTASGPAGSTLIVRSGGPPPAARAETTHARAPFMPQPMSTPDEIVVTSRYELERAVGASIGTLSNDDIADLPDLGDDALRAVSRLPGTATNGFSALGNIRGGEADETLVRVDGLRLFNAFHLEGFQSVFSTVDPRLVHTMDVYTGGFPAAFGDRMSGVVDVTSIEAPADIYHEVGASFFNSSVLSSGRFSGGDGEWLASLRRSNLDALYSVFSEQPVRPIYRDAFAKVSYDVNDALRLTGHALYFDDDIWLAGDVELDEQAFADDQDRYLWLRLDQRLANLDGTTLVGQVELETDRSGVTNQEGASRGSVMDHRRFDVSFLQSDWSWQPREGLRVMFGGSTVHFSGRYRYRDAVEFDVLLDPPSAPGDAVRVRSLDLQPSGHQYALHGGVRYQPTPRFTFDTGLRWDQSTLDPQRRSTLSPRLAVRYRVAPRSFVRASWGRFHQSQWINELQVEDGVATYFAPQRADHVVVGFEHVFARGLTVRVEAYDKAMASLRPRYENLLNPLTLLPELKPDRIRIAPSEARARGIEWLVGQRLGETVSWSVAYSRSRAEDRVDGEWMRRSWDQTNALTAALTWDAGKWSGGFGLTYRSGWPTTPVSFEEDGTDPPIVSVGTRNSTRVRAYRSADFRLTRHFALARGNLSAFIEVSNLTGRRNPCCTEYQIATTADNEIVLDLARIDYLPRVPSIGFVWTF